MRMLTENKLKSTSIERFRAGQVRRKVKPAAVSTIDNSEEDLVSWKQIFRTFGSLILGAVIFIGVIFVFAIATLL